MSKQRYTSMADALKQALSDSDVSWSELERETGVKRGSARRFLEGRHMLRLDKADDLARYFGITVNLPKGRGR